MTLVSRGQSLQAEQAKTAWSLDAKNVRRTIVVHTKLAGHMARVEAARSGAHGVQVLTMGQMAARLAGGFIAPIDTGTLQDAVREALPETDLGELENIKNLPGMVRAVVGTLEKVWQANIELSSHSHPRLQALAGLERNVLGRLPPYMKKPKDLVELACARISYARRSAWSGCDPWTQRNACVLEAAGRRTFRCCPCYMGRRTTACSRLGRRKPYRNSANGAERSNA